MLWTLIAAVLILNGFFNNDALEIASAVLFAALGVRRAVMRWDKPGALVNFVVILLAIVAGIYIILRGRNRRLP